MECKHCVAFWGGFFRSAFVRVVNCKICQGKMHVHHRYLDRVNILCIVVSSIACVSTIRLEWCTGYARFFIAIASFILVYLILVSIVLILEYINQAYTTIPLLHKKVGEFK
jgi:hypothetical protein